MPTPRPTLTVVELGPLTICQLVAIEHASERNSRLDQVPIPGRYVLPGGRHVGMDRLIQIAKQHEWPYPRVREW